MSEHSKVTPGVRCMLIVTGWALILCSVLLLAFGVSLPKLFLALASIVLLIVFYRL